MVYSAFIASYWKLTQLSGFDKRFRSPQEFAPHAIWLMTGCTSPCWCRYCSGEPQAKVNSRLNNQPVRRKAPKVGHHHRKPKVPDTPIQFKDYTSVMNTLFYWIFLIYSCLYSWLVYSHTQHGCTLALISHVLPPSDLYSLIHDDPHSFNASTMILFDIWTPWNLQICPDLLIQKRV